MGDVMLQHNKVMLEGQKLLGPQGNMLRFEEEKTKTGGQKEVEQAELKAGNSSASQTDEAQD